MSVITVTTAKATFSIAKIYLSSYTWPCVGVPLTQCGVNGA